MVIEQTDQFAATKHCNSPSAHPWVDTTIDEMKAFAGVLMLMGLLKLPRLELMPRVRFEQLYRFLHLCDNTHQIPS